MTSVVTSLAQWRELTDEWRRGGATVGLTMTMGALHQGHTSLFDAAAQRCDVSLATIFVNPLQFGDEADLDRYPRTLDHDVAILRDAGVAAVLAPEVREVWPCWPDATPTTVHVAGITERFEGEGRPGHFDGVATVVAKLLIATGSCTAFFGEKDYQQLCMVRRLVVDLGLPNEIVACPIVRDADGLALSSRNARLTARGRAVALSLSRALEAGRRLVEQGESIECVEAEMAATVAAVDGMTLEYAAVVAPGTLARAAGPVRGEDVRLLIAGTVEGVRLIDNLKATWGARA